MIKYITNTVYGCNIYHTTHQTSLNINNLSLVKKMCLEELFSYEGYLKGVKAKFGSVRLIPVYINKNILLIPTKRVRDYENIWLNYSQILLIESSDNKTKVTFKDYTNITINIKYHNFIKRIKLAKKIINYKLSRS